MNLFLRRCNGYSFNQTKLTEANLATFKALVAEVRTAFQPEVGASFHRGSRFNSDETVLGRIQSAIQSEDEFAQDPEAWINDALRDCGGADHWYTFEKEWD